MLYDAVGYTPKLAAAFTDAVSMTTQVIADTMVELGQQALIDLHSFADAVGDGVQQTTRDVIDATNDLIIEAAALAEAGARAAAESVDEVIDAATEVAEETVRVVGEARGGRRRVPVRVAGGLTAALPSRPAVGHRVGAVGST